MRRLLAATALLVVVACSREFDPKLRDEGVENANEALVICQEHVPKEAEGLTLLLATPTTAGDITEDARTQRRETVAPWDSLAPDHLVASCNFGTSPEEPATTWLIDDAGRTTREPSSSGA